MGGVLARYALAEAEESGNPLDVSHYASLNAPHQGAVIDKQLLDWIKSHSSSHVDNFKNMLKSIAAKQLLVYNPYATDEHGAVMTRSMQPMATAIPKKLDIGVAFSK